jgi:nucleotide-binding universal stress UspA family protein
MKLRVHFDISDRHIDETVEGPSADEILAEAKSRVAKELGWKGMFLHAMSTLQFAQLAVRLYNEHNAAGYPTPESAEEFIAFGRATGNVDVLEA